MGLNIIFAHTGVHYASYVDYHELVSLAGFATCHLSQVDFTQEDTVYIITPHTGEWKPHWQNWRKEPHKAVTIMWCLERPGKAGGIWPYVERTKEILNEGLFDYIWLSDRWLTQMVDDSRCQFVVLGSDARLGTLDKLPIEHDICHFSCHVHRRQKILSNIKDRRVAPNGWDEERTQILRSSQLLLNIHQDDWPIIEPLRFALAAAYGLPIVTEEITDCYPYNRISSTQYCVQQPYHELLEYLNEMVYDDSLQSMGWRAHDLMTTEFGFQRQVELAVERIAASRPLDGIIIR